MRNVIEIYVYGEHRVVMSTSLKESESASAESHCEKRVNIDEEILESQEFGTE